MGRAILRGKGATHCSLLRSAHWLVSSLKLAARCPVSGCWPCCCRLSKESRWILYRILEYDPLLDSTNMTYDDYVRLATDISVSLLKCIDKFAFRSKCSVFIMHLLG